MLSVTQRIETVSQPIGGYISKDLFTQTQYEDGCILKNVPTDDSGLLSIQGAAVDYLTRYILTGNKTEAFHIAILGAQKLDEAYGNAEATSRVLALIERINGLDNDSIRAACQIVGYDVAYRKNILFYKDVEENFVPGEMILNIKVMVARGVAFLKELGPVIMSELTFEGGYTDLVSSGDGDYLTADTLVDFKVSKNDFSSKWSLQLLMYYLLGIHSVHPEYKYVSRLCVFNPLENRSYIVQLSDVSNETKYWVSHDVLGYKMMTDPVAVKIHKADCSSWDRVNGTDSMVIYQFLTDRMNLGVKFDASQFNDGIHKISVNEYWFCLGERDKEYRYCLRPKFRFVDHILMLKKNGYLMFMSVTTKGKLGILSGGRIKSATFSAQYYYDNMERYVSVVLASFSDYWGVMKKISRQLRSLTPSEECLRAQYSLEKIEYKELYNKDVGTYKQWRKARSSNYRLSGKVHGCIVDLDIMNHIYVNPYDGTITPYYAESMYNKDIYKNVKSLFAAQRPEFLDSLENLLIESGKNDLVVVNKQHSILLVKKDDEICDRTQKVYSHDMYSISNRLKPLQKIYDCKLIQVWYDDVLKDDIKLIASENLAKKQRSVAADKYVGKSAMQRGGKVATIIGYRNCNDIDVVFEDGYQVRTNTQNWKKGGIVHPDVKDNIKESEVEKSNKTIHRSKRRQYVGMTKRMNCGLNATVIEYVDCHNLTVQFEDGLIVRNIRTDHFKEGKVAHRST